MSALCGYAKQNAEVVAANRLLRKNSTLITKELEAQRIVEARKKTILFLGTGESGKSTLFKQMKFINGASLGSAERLKVERASIHSMIVLDVINLVRGSTLPPVRVAMGFDAISPLPWSQAVIDLNNGEELTQQSFRKSLMHLCDHGTGAEAGFEITPIAAVLIDTIWKDALTAKLLSHRNMFQLGDHATYFLDKVTEIAQDSWLPAETDIVRARVKTIGVIEQVVTKNIVTFNNASKTISLNLIDVGGQRSERRKWVSQFDRVAAIVFVVAISEFDETCTEDPTVPRHEESLRVFQSIIAESALEKIGVMVFFNKIDVLKEKLKTRSFKKYLPDFQGEETLRRVCDHGGEVQKDHVFDYQNSYLLFHHSH